MSEVGRHTSMEETNRGRGRNYSLHLSFRCFRMIIPSRTNVQSTFPNTKDEENYIFHGCNVIIYHSALT